MLEQCRSALDLCSQTAEKKKTHIGHPLHECSFNQEKSIQNSCLAPDSFLKCRCQTTTKKSGRLRRDRKTCLSKTIEIVHIVEDEDDDEELIERTEEDDILTTHMGMVNLLKNDSECVSCITRTLTK